MKTLVVSSSFDPISRSEELARKCEEVLRNGSEVRFLTIKDYRLESGDLHAPLNSAVYRELHRLVSDTDGLVLASPIYNWGCCAELKRFVEVLGTTPADGSVRSPFFDKVITFVNAAGLPHSYMAFSGMAISMMMDFKCIVSPYNIYATERDWEGGKLSRAVTNRLTKSMEVFLQLISLLSGRTYQSSWEI